MKLSVFVYKRKSAGFANAPVFTQYNKEQYVEGFKQGINDFKVEELEHFKDLELHYLGTFDNVALTFDLIGSDTFVLDCAPLAIQVLTIKGGINNGKSN